LFQLMINIRALRVAEVQAVRHRQGQRSGAAQVAADLGDHDHATLVGVQSAKASVAVDGQRDGLLGALHPQDRGIAPRPHHSVGLHLMVVLPVDTLLVGDIGRRQQPQQCCLRAGLRQRDRVKVQLESFDVRLRRLAFQTVLGRLRKGSDGQVGHQFRSDGHLGGLLGDDQADLPADHVPFLKDGPDGRHVFRGHHQQHPLLGLREHHLVGAHALLTLMDLGYIKSNTPASAGRRLHRRAGQPRCSQVLDSVHQTCG